MLYSRFPKVVYASSSIMPKEIRNAWALIDELVNLQVSVRLCV
jgi:hypothetical protein